MVIKGQVGHQGTGWSERDRMVIKGQNGYKGTPIDHAMVKAADAGTYVDSLILLSTINVSKGSLIQLNLQKGKNCVVRLKLSYHYP